jgi:hypothetical protein
VVSQCRQNGVDQGRRSGTEPAQLTPRVISEPPIGGSQGCSLLKRTERYVPLGGVVGDEGGDLLGGGSVPNRAPRNGSAGPVPD